MEMLNITLFGEMLTFIVLVFVTMKYVWPPIMKAIESRQKEIADGLAAAERGQHDLTLAQQKSMQIIQEAKNEAQDLLEQARLQSNVIVERSKSQAKNEGLRLLQLAQADIAKEKISAQQDVQQQIIDLTLLVSEKFLRENAGSVANKQLLEQLIRKVQGENR